MTQDLEFKNFLKGLRDGDASSGEVLFRRYSRNLIELARSRLGFKLRRKLDPEDVVQSAFRSFLRLQENPNLILENWSALWGLLAKITLFKCYSRIGYFQAARRDIRSERFEEKEIQSNELSPDESAMIAETLEQFFQSLRERDRQIFRLALEGLSVADISLEISRSERTIQRVLEYLKTELIRRTEGDGAD